MGLDISRRGHGSHRANSERAVQATSSIIDVFIDVRGVWLQGESMQLRQSRCLRPQPDWHGAPLQRLGRDRSEPQVALERVLEHCRHHQREAMVRQEAQELISQRSSEASRSASRNRDEKRGTGRPCDELLRRRRRSRRSARRHAPKPKARSSATADQVAALLEVDRAMEGNGTADGFLGVLEGTREEERFSQTGGLDPSARRRPR